MRCKTCREGLSARLDDEEPGVPGDEMQAHLAACPGCREWLAAAQRLHREARVAPAEHVPDLVAEILAAIPEPVRPRHWVTAMRWSLLVVAAGQLVLSVPELAGQVHLDHEVAAWTVAAAVGFLSVAWRPRCVGGALPVMAAAVVALGAISIRDVATGHAHLQREGTHLLLVAGVLLLLALWRSLPDDRPGPAAVVDTSAPPHRGSRRAA